MSVFSPQVLLWSAEFQSAILKTLENEPTFRRPIEHEGPLLDGFRHTSTSVLSGEEPCLRTRYFDFSTQADIKDKIPLTTIITAFYSSIAPGVNLAIRRGENSCRLSRMISAQQTDSSSILSEPQWEKLLFPLFQRALEKNGICIEEQKVEGAPRSIITLSWGAPE